MEKITMPNILIAKATAALQESVASIIGCDENDATKREALVETFAQFQTYMERNGADIAKAHEHRGQHELAASLVQHLHDRLDRHRERHGYTKAAKETPSMTSHSEFVQSVVKQYGIVALAKSMIQDQKSYGLDEPTFTRLATEHAQRIYPNDRPDVAFSKLYQSEESVRRGCALYKAMPFQVDLQPLMVGGEDTRDLSDQSEAIAHLKELGARKWPTATEAQQFANAFTDPVNATLAAKAHRRPQAMTSFPFPR
jgi:hypothetical protein